MEEIWRDIDGYEGLYKVSNLGNIKSLNYRRTGKEEILKAEINNGYLYVILYKERKIKLYLVHRLVAIAFIPNPYNLPEINHKDEDRTNNIVSNLEWCNRQYNNIYGKRLQSISKKVLCVETNKIYNSMKEAERDLGCDHSHISAVCRGKRKTCGGYHWKYIN